MKALTSNRARSASVRGSAARSRMACRWNMLWCCVMTCRSRHAELALLLRKQAKLLNMLSSCKPNRGAKAMMGAVARQWSA